MRRAREAGLWADFSNERIDDFYDVYTTNMRDLGTPTFPKTMFNNFLAEFGDNAKILNIWLGHKVIASVLIFYYKDTVLPYYGGSISKYNNNKIAPNNFMYWTVMQDAIENGYRVFDFGRSKANTGAYHFKRHFGMQPEPLNYQYLLVQKDEKPNLNPLNPKYQRFINTWKRLPIPVTKLVGPRIVRNIP